MTRRYAQETKPYPPRFYIRCTDRLSNEGAVLWWRAERKGYTSNLDQAGLYEEAEARQIEKLRGTDEAVRQDIAERSAQVIRLVGPLVLRAEVARG